MEVATRLRNGVYTLALRKEEMRYAELTAREAAKVLNLVGSKVDGSTPTLVIANKRYGSYFVVPPIEDSLADIDVKVVHEYVPSSGFIFHDMPSVRYISDETWEWIVQHNPNVFVVDGTSQPISNGLTRFPAAMWGYINAFNAYNAACGIKHPNQYIEFSAHWESQKLRRYKPSNGYRVGFWAPSMTPEIFIGGCRFVPDLVKEENGLTRDMTIVCSTSVGNGFSEGYFDDPERHMRHVKGHYNRYSRTYDAVEKIFVGAVQRAIRKGIHEYLK